MALFHVPPLFDNQSQKFPLAHLNDVLPMAQLLVDILHFGLIDLD